MKVKYIITGCLALAAVSLGGVLFGLLQSAQAAPTPYTTTITNFDPSSRQVIKFDVDGNAVDAHDGDLAYFEGKYYLYGTSYDCGYKLQTPGTPFCGFKSYSSTDLVHWTDEGFLFNGTTPAWQANCAPPRFGCYRPHVLYNDSTDKYVLWINSYDNASGYHVFTADTPTGPFVEQAEPVLADSGAPGSFVNGDMDLFKDDNGTAYITYTNIPGNHTIKIQQLNSSYTSGVGNAVSVGASGSEAPSLFRKSDRYYLVYGPTCPYCNGTSTQYKSATTPLGSWSGATQLNGNSCGGQPSFVANLPGASGDNYVYGSDLWAGSDQPNQAMANYFWTPLSFNGTAINGFGCSQTVSLTLGDGAAGKPNLPAGSDQSSGLSYFRAHCDAWGSWTRQQSFAPSRSGTLKSLSFTTFKVNNPSTPLQLDIFMLDNNGAPVGPALHTATIPAASVGSSPRNVTISPNITVYGGMRYGIASGPGSNNGSCYGFIYNDYKTYQHGNAYYKPGNGGSWTLESARSLKFSTVLE